MRAATAAGSSPSAAVELAPSCAGNRHASAPSVCGSITALAGPWPMPCLAHERLRQHVVQPERRRVERVAAEQRAERQRVAGRLRARAGNAPRISRALSGRDESDDRVAVRLAQRLRRVAERVQRARRQRRTGCDADSRGSLTTTDGRTRGVARVDAARVPVPAGHLRARQRRGNRHRAGPAGGGQRLRDVDHPPAPSATSRSPRDRLPQVAGDVLDQRRIPTSVHARRRRPRRAAPAPAARSVVSNA